MQLVPPLSCPNLRRFRSLGFRAKGKPIVKSGTQSHGSLPEIASLPNGSHPVGVSAITRPFRAQPLHTALSATTDRKAKVLVAEDSRAVAKVVQSANLSALRFWSQVAFDGREAWESAQDEHFDLVVTG